MSKKMVLYDSQACIKCFACTIACATENRVRLQRDKGYNIEKSSLESLPHLNFITPEYSEHGEFPDVVAVTALKHCNHCTNPQCVSICPTKAITQGKDGAVVINQEQCVGCSSCYDACPYNIPKYSTETGRTYKCTMCNDRLKAGLKTACSEVCPSVAIISGDADMVRAEAIKRIENYEEKFGKKFVAYGLDHINSTVGSLNYITIAPEENCDEYLLPKSPRSKTGIARDILKVGGIVAGVATIAGIGIHARHWNKNKADSELNNDE